MYIRRLQWFYPTFCPPCPKVINRVTFVKQTQTKKSPKFLWNSFAVRTGLEPVTPCVTGMYSNQLN